MAASTTWSMPTTGRGRSIRRFGPTRSSRSAACPTRCSTDERAAQVVDAVERGSGRRSAFARSPPDDAGYVPRYEGGVRARDGAYHQGTVWPWLHGTVRGGVGPGARRRARSCGARPGGASSSRCCGISRGAGSGTSPRSPTPSRRTRRAGCPFQAWSVGEALRLDLAGSGRSRHGFGARRQRGAYRRRRSGHVSRGAGTGPSTPWRPRCSASSWSRPACFTVLLFYPAWPVARRFPTRSPGGAHGPGDGVDRDRAQLLGLGEAVRRPLQPGCHAHLLPGWARSAPRDAAGYIVAQFVGAVLGVLVARSLVRTMLARRSGALRGDSPGPRGGVAAAFVAEVVISSILMTVVLIASNSRRLAPYTGLFAGLLVATFITFEAPLSGMSMNPARTVGSAFWAGDWTALWIYFTAPPLGMLAGGRAVSAKTRTAGSLLREAAPSESEALHLLRVQADGRTVFSSERPIGEK